MTDTEVVVVGGGSTGTGVARDLSMRGVDVALVERGSLAEGTTGRMHGLLHSGGRYAVSDPESARDCIVESSILRDIAPHCVEPTGGLFAKRPADSEDYFERKLRGCEDCGIPAEVLSGEEARSREPHLADEVERAIAVPDAAVDPFRLCVANAVDAEARGTRIETHTAVTDVLVEAGEVVGVEVDHDDAAGRRGTEAIRADHVVNAAGAWAGELASMAGVDVTMSPSKGAMAVVDLSLDAVLNRCRPKEQGDIVVPCGDTAILGTTDESVDDPDEYEREDREIDLLIEELSALIPEVADAPLVATYWGVRPLYESGEAERANSTAVTRSYTLLDHRTRDGLAGLTTIVGGKLTTYRAMAEAVADRVCDRLGVSGRCRTAEEPLPGREDGLDDALDQFGVVLPDGRRSV